MIAYGIALGSNVGDRAANLHEGVARVLEAIPDACLKAEASFYETEPVGCAPGTQAFLNSVIEVETAIEPMAVYRTLAEIEQAMGRPAERAKNAPRTLDLDILYAGDWVSEDPALTVPHPRLHERRFVLEPLAEIRAGLKLPGFGGRTVGDLLAALEDDLAVVRVGDRRREDERQKT